jgi:hypothetical protein
VRGRSPTRITAVASRESAAVTAIPATTTPAAAPVTAPVVLTATVTSPTAATTATTVAAAGIVGTSNKHNDNSSSGSSSDSDTEHSSSSDEVVKNTSRNRALLQRKSIQDRLQRVGANPTNRDPPEIEVRTCTFCYSHPYLHTYSDGMYEHAYAVACVEQLVV